MSKGLQLDQMTLTVEEVTTKTAAQWLKKNKCNRPLSKRTVEQYARDQKAGQWYAKPLAVCFDEDGNLINGQHSLNAILVSRETQTFLVARDVPKETIVVLDRGRNRSLSEVAHFFEMNIPGRAFSVARGLEFGMYVTAPRSFYEQLQAVQKHQEALDWMLKYSPKPHSWIKPFVLVIVMRAWYTEDRDRLAEFLQVLDTGLQPHGRQDSGAVLLREMCKDKKETVGVKTGKHAFERRIINALAGFLERRELKFLSAKGSSAAERFPLPGEVISTPEIAPKPGEKPQGFGGKKGGAK